MDKNIQAYFKMEKELVRKYHGKYAVFHNGKLVSVDKNLGTAVEKAEKKTGAKEFFVHPLYTIEEQTNAIIVIM